MDKPDFGKYSAAQLRQILTRIDKERFPERVQEIHERLALLDEQAQALESSAPDIPAAPAALASRRRRFGASLIDGLVLAALGFGLGLPLGDQFEAMGPWARLVGFAIAMLYFGAMESSLFQGRTLGKIALDLRVADLSGASLSLPRASLRAGIFWAPLLASGCEWGPAAMAGSALSLAIAYLALFNRRAKQSLHDLLTGSVVLRGEGDLAPTPRMWRGHWVALAGLCFLCVGGALYGDATLEQSGAPMVAAHGAISKMPWLRAVQVVENQFPDGKRILSVQALASREAGDPAAIAKRVAQAALASYPPDRRPDMVAVAIRRGYDIGVASRWSTWSFHATPKQWLEAPPEGLPLP